MPKLKTNINNKRGGFGNRQEIGTNYNYTNTEGTNYTNTKNKISYADESPLDELNENIKEILYESDNMDKYEEEKGKLLFEKLKTRYNNFDMKISKSKSKDKNKRKNW